MNSFVLPREICVLPPEICAHICELIDPSLLGPVCRVSRVFRDEGQLFLFRSVDLRSCDIKSVRSWCLAVIRHSHLAERVHTLSLQLPDKLDPADAGRISSSFRKCVNLKSLAVFYDRSSPRTSASVYIWMLENCTFRLTAFTNSYFESEELKEFWDMQPDIRLLSFPEPYTCYWGSMPDDSQLPNLIAVEIADDIRLGSFISGTTRPLQRIQMPSKMHISSLSRYSASLTTLNILQPGPVSIEGIIQRVVAALPALVHLGISEVHTPIDVYREINPISYLEGFTRLETLVLKTRVVSLHNAGPSVFYLDTATDLRVFGLAVMKACPTLRKTAISSFAEFSCVLTRVPGSSSILSEEGTGFDFDKVSKFWSG